MFPSPALEIGHLPTGSHVAWELDSYYSKGHHFRMTRLLWYSYRIMACVGQGKVDFSTMFEAVSLQQLWIYRCRKSDEGG